MATRKQWGVLYEASSTEEYFIFEGFDEEIARELVNGSPTDRGLRVRLVTDWVEVD